MNLIPVIREALGLQEHEEFNLKNDRNVVFPDKFRFTDSTLQIKEGERWVESHSMMFKLLLKGECEVVKQPFKPNEYDAYYFVNLYFGTVEVSAFSKDFTADVIRVNSGNCYRTREEAAKHINEWMSKVYGKDWRELLK